VDFDLVVIGGGAAGLAAARSARRRQATVALVSSGPLGGDCTFYGCVPSKTLIEAAAQGLDFAAAADRVRATVARIAGTENAEVLRAEGIEVFEASARLSGRHQLRAGDATLHYRRLVIATGSTPASAPIAGLDGVGALTNETVFGLTSRPATLLILGGGPIGVELGQAFARLGTAVTIVEAADRLLAREEPEASAVVGAALGADGVQVLTGRRITKVGGQPGAITAQLDDTTTLHAEQLLMAVGRQPRTRGLDLDGAGVALDERGFVRTDTRLRTTAADVFAAGDVTGRALFTHAADDMGRIAAGNALSPVAWRRFRADAIPAVTYTRPEVARVGLTEEAAAAIPGARVAELPLTELDRAITAGRTDGYIKLIVAPRRGVGQLGGGRLVGATIVADRAGEMIAVPTLALRTGMLPARLALTVQAYPTWSLGVRQAAAQLFVETGGRRARPARPRSS
jgi:pyruvate/2-oxoglutarate dehydrogenase complex dihydrolipoamide dehydrogenase (E3) component